MRVIANLNSVTLILILELPNTKASRVTPTQRFSVPSGDGLLLMSDAPREMGRAIDTLEAKPERANPRYFSTVPQTLTPLATINETRETWTESKLTLISWHGW